MKKQFRYFHGKIKEHSFKKLFSIYRSNISNRSNSFFFVLESRLDMVFFRRRILPTVFACNQYIQHHGIMINDQKETSPSYYVNVGDIISFPKKS
jgi:ribosomal protein S4